MTTSNSNNHTALYTLQITTAHVKSSQLSGTGKHPGTSVYKLKAHIMKEINPLSLSVQIQSWYILIGSCKPLILEDIMYPCHGVVSLHYPNFSESHLFFAL
jgi:hypothetical protein